METIYSDLQQLGGKTELPASPEEAMLEKVANPQADVDYCVRFTAPEFTSLCPMTGQPDFAHLVIDYVPDQYLVESKSLKLYLGAFRNHGAFHEDCTDVFWQTGETPKSVWIPDQGVPPYRGRG